ncbi:MAG: hypothetical protein LBJ00_07060, partial [Planctomycetaceae bacterium]|nr:hypothetical protein [Planctomycetaceae bacterium]
MLRRRKKIVGVSEEMDGQDSFLDIVSNIVGILIILVMIAGVRAQNSGNVDPQQVGVDDEKKLRGESDSLGLPVIQEAGAKYANEKMIRGVEEKFVEYKTKEQDTENIRRAITDIQATAGQIAEQIELQEVEREKLLGLIVDLRAEIEIRAEERGESAKAQVELQRKLNEADAKLTQLGRTKQWLEAERPKTVVMENMPTPISKTVEEKEVHFRLKQGKIIYVPINELTESFLHEVNLNQAKFFANRATTGRVGPIFDFVMDYLVVRYNATLDGSGGGVGQRIGLEMAAYTTNGGNVGVYYKDAISSENSEFLRRVLQFRQNVYTITFWV